jgi:hypothetical protein
MKNLVIMAVFGLLVFQANAQKQIPAGIPQTGQAVEIKDIHEDVRQPGKLLVRFVCDSLYYPIKLSVGDTVVVISDPKVKSYTFVDAPWEKYNEFQRRYVVYAEDKRVWYHTKTYTTGVIPEYAGGIGSQSVSVEEELIIRDNRTPRLPLAEAKTPIEKEDLTPMDTLEIEYEQGDHTQIARAVYSADSTGNYHRVGTNRFESGYRTDDQGRFLVGMLVRVAPYRVYPGEKVYRIVIAFGSGQEIHQQIRVLEDIPGSM